jgi:hypothetical protein
MNLVRSKDLEEREFVLLLIFVVTSLMNLIVYTCIYYAGMNMKNVNGATTISKI